MNPWEEIKRGAKLVILIFTFALLLSIVIGLEDQFTRYLEWAMNCPLGG